MRTYGSGDAIHSGSGSEFAVNALSSATATTGVFGNYTTLSAKWRIPDAMQLRGALYLLCACLLLLLSVMLISTHTRAINRS